MQTADVVIVGGGVVGSSIAYNLKNDGFTGRVLVVERDPTYEFASTPLSMGGVRQQFGTAISIRIMQYATRIYEQFDDLMAVGDERAEAGLHQTGYLFLADDANWDVLHRRYDLQQGLGVEAEILDPPAIEKIMPELNLEGIRGGFFCHRDGYVDPHGVLHGFIKKAKALGAQYATDEVVRILTDGGRVRAVVTKTGDEIQAPIVVNAAGAYAGQVGALAGVEVPVVPLRRQLYVGQPPRALGMDLPMIIDPGGVHWRPESVDKILIAKTKREETPGVKFGWERDHFIEKVWPDLARRVPLFGTLKLVRGWGGLYEVSPDENAILGEHPDLRGFLLANGFSGHGLMMSPATGKLLSECIRLGRFETLDATCLGLDRFARGQPIHEEAII